MFAIRGHTVLTMYVCAILVFLCLSVSGFGKLPEPTNVRVDSVNFKNTLRWDPPQGFGEYEDIKYTVQYKLDFNKPSNYNTVCVTQDLECDLTYVTYKFYARVKAEVADKKSDWVTRPFNPYSTTVIGPPDVLVSSRSGHLDVRIYGPYLESKTEKGSIKDKYGELLYRVFYWKEEDPFDVQTVNTSQNTETLTKLETWTNYCVTVQAYISEYEKEGEFSPEVCEKTTDDGRTPWWQTASVFIITMLVIMTVTFGLCYFGIIAYRKYTSFPSYSIPEHLKEYLSKPFNSTPSLQTQPLEECGESFEQLTFISEESEETKDEARETD